MNKFLFATIICAMWCVADVTLSAQCPKVLSFCSQEEVDLFPTTYKGCREIDTLYIDFSHCLGQTNDISNLDSLASLEYVEHLVLKSGSDIADVSGLRMKKVKYMEVQMQKQWTESMGIDSFGSINITFPIDSVTDISLFKNLKYIEDGIGVVGNGQLTPRLQYNCGPGYFSFQLATNKRQNKLKNILPQNVNSNLSLIIVNCANLDCDLDTAQDSFISFKISQCSKLNLGNLSKLKYCREFVIINQQEMGAEFENFQLERADFFTLLNNRTPLDGNKIFPNLKRVRTRLWVEFNKNLTNLAFLDKCHIPNKDESWRYYNYIKVADNNLLETCNSNFLCRAFKVYPDSIIVENNFKDCNEELTNRPCDPISSISENSENFVSIYPNPTSGLVIISCRKESTVITIINNQGQLVKQKECDGHEIDISDLPAGMYIFDVRNNNLNQQYKVIKVD